MKFNNFRWLGPLGLVALLLACVTVNVYFPAKEVEKKATDIIDDIRKQPPTPPKPPTGASPQSSLNHLLADWSWVGTAYAQTDSPAINNLKQQIRERFPRLLPFFQRGVVGEGRTGLVEIRNVEGLSAAERNDVKALVEAENRDRRALYQEVARSMNITPDQIGKVQRIFAEKWQSSAERGWWIQREDGQWIQK